MTVPGPGWMAFAVMGLASLVTGCDPIVNVYGAFFPAWAVCLLLGVLGAALLRVVFAASGVEDGFAPVLLVYPALAFAIACGAWIALFRS